MNIRSPKNIKYLVLSVIAFVLCMSGTSLSITLDEAIKRAIDVSYTLKEQKEVVKRSGFSYISTIDPYLPRVDITGSYTRSLTSESAGGDSGITSTTVGGFTSTFDSKELYSFYGTITYRLFDGGERYSKRGQAFSLLEKEKERLKGVRTDVLYFVKTGFYVALGNKAIAEKRKEAFQTAEKVFALTKGRYEAGVAKKSEVLQAEVRMTTAKIDWYDAIKEYEKALAEFKSFLLYDPKDPQDVEGPLEPPRFGDDYQGLVDRAVRVRPDVTAQVQEVERLNMVYKERKSAWFPKIDALLQQTRQDIHFFPDGRQDAFIINLTYPLFDGVGRYYNMLGATSDISAAKYRLAEIKRNTEIEIVKAFKDYELSTQNVKLYAELVREATSNFNQAYGEYRVGKGDILALLQSERDLAKAKENEVTAIYKANTSLSFLEKVAYLSGE